MLAKDHVALSQWDDCVLRCGARSSADKELCGEQSKEEGMSMICVVSAKVRSCLEVDSRDSTRASDCAMRCTSFGLGDTLCKTDK